MPRRWILFLLSLAAVGLVVLGVFWKVLNPPAAYWGEAKARDYQQASLEYKAAATRPDRRASESDDPELIAARQRLEQLQGELDRAVSRRGYVGWVLVASGLLLAAVAAAGFISGWSEADSRAH